MEKVRYLVLLLFITSCAPSDKAAIDYYVLNEPLYEYNVEEKIQDINNIGISNEMALQCPNEECPENIGKENPDDYYVFNSKVNFDPVNFFMAS